MSGAMTTVAYEGYGNYLRNKHFPEGVDDKMSCHDFRKALLEKTGDDDYLMYESGYEQPVDVPLFGLKKGEIQWIDSHSGISLGRNLYGQNYILSKLNVNLPVTVKTNTYFLNLYKNAWINISGYGYVRTVKSRVIIY